MAGTIETWWWPLGEFNGGGDDGFLTTSNYPYRVWGWLKAMGGECILSATWQDQLSTQWPDGAR